MVKQVLGAQDRLFYSNMGKKTVDLNDVSWNKLIENLKQQQAFFRIGQDNELETLM